MRFFAQKKETVYSLLFLLLMAVAMHAYFVFTGTDFSEACCDSVKQILHFYPFLQNEYLHGNLFWSWKYGLGGDIFAEFLYYYSSSPFFWLSLLFQITSIDKILELRLFISIFKLFLAMVFMFLYLRYLRRSRTASLLGSLIYGGSLYFTFYSLRYDFMIDGMVWLPLLILSLERLIDERKKGLFVFSVFLNLCTNFYLAYINTIFLFLYVILKSFLHEDRFRFGDFLKQFAKISGYYLLGVLLSAFSFIPAVYTFFQVDRFYYKIQIPILFNAQFYERLFYYLFSFAPIKSVNFIVQFPIVTYLLLFYGFFIRDKQTRVRFRFMLIFFGLALIPYTYSVFNGFSTMQIRWLYLLVFIVASVIAFLFDHLMQEQRQRFVTLYLGVLLLILCVMLGIKPFLASLSITRYDLANFLIGLGLAGIFLLYPRISKQRKWILICGLVSLVSINIVLMNYHMFYQYLKSPYTLQKKLDYRMSQQYNNPEVHEIINSIKKEDPSFYRIIWDQVYEFNAPMVYQYYGFGAYNSLLFGDVHRFFKKEYNTLQYNTPSLFKNLDNRLYIETALANKYYIIPKDDPYQPYGYSLFMTTDHFTVWINNYALPIGFLYNAVVDRSTFNRLNEAEKDELLFHAAVVEDGQKIHLPRFNPESLTITKVIPDQNRIKFQNASLQGKVLTVGKNGKLIIPYTPSNIPGELLVKIKVKPFMGSDYTLKVEGKLFQYFGENTAYNYPKEEIVFNLGNHFKKKEIEIQISPGKYRLDGIMLLFHSYEKYPQLVAEKQKNALQDVQYTEDSVAGRIVANKDGILFLSIPYSKGWKVKVDGNEVEPLKVNTAFVGIPVKKGTHQIEMHYVTPYLPLGAGISFMTLFLVVLVYGVKNYKLKDRQSCHYEPVAKEIRYGIS